MPEPEISRRCRHCGASVSERAFFCPQCGKQLNRDHKAGTDSHISEPPNQPSQANVWLQETIAEPANRSSTQTDYSLQETIADTPANRSSQETDHSLQETIADMPANRSSKEASPSFRETLADASTKTLDESLPVAKQPLLTKGAGRKDRSRRKKDRELLARYPEPIAPGIEMAAPEAETEEKKYRPTSAAREVLEDNVLQRVERLRKVSTVVIDQAAYDPSLRFVLVAAFLFGLFLLIALISKLIG
ncbi:MAG TPA: hypothetical protein VIV66_01545 [Pyrinomonadaceae bacterium]